MADYPFRLRRRSYGERAGFNPPCTLHGVVFDILVASGHRAGLANTETADRTSPKTQRNPYFTGLSTGDPSRIRTCNPRSRNPLLYPVELWDRCRLHSIANMKNPRSRQVRSEPFLGDQRPSRAVGRCFRSAFTARLRRGPPAALPKGLSRPCRMRLFRKSFAWPRVRHLFAPFCANRGETSASPGAPS
jgi:hypothetical protein